MAEVVKFGRPKGFFETFERRPGSIKKNMSYCPGCGHGILHKLIAEAMADFGIQDKTTFISPVGCSVFAYYYFDCFGLQVPHGRSAAAATGLTRANPDSIVIVDEAYVDFGAKTALPLLDKYENLLVVQTFSKSRAMAGARVGFAIGNPALIKYLRDVKFSFNSYTMNLPSIRIGTASALDDAWFTETTKKIADTREYFKKEISAMGFEFPDSKSNFVFARHPGFSGADLQARLRKRGIIVRHFNKPRISDYLRITIGTREQMETVVSALKEILADGAGQG